jgi:hypothetical protein
MLLGMLPRGQVCVTPRAVLGFHAAWNFDESGQRVTSASATHTLLEIYPPSVRHWIAQRGGLSPHMKLLRGRTLATMYPMCGGVARPAEAARTHHRGSHPVRAIEYSASARSAR